MAAEAATETAGATQSGAVNLEPQFADSRHLAFVSTQHGHFNLFVADLTESGLGQMRALVAAWRRRSIATTTRSSTTPSIPAEPRRQARPVRRQSGSLSSGDIWSSSTDPDDRRRVLVEETTGRRGGFLPTASASSTAATRVVNGTNCG
jgi:hypothetical protein